MTSVTLTLEQLEAWGACEDQVALGLLYFGTDRLRLTRTRLAEMAALGLHLAWLAGHILPRYTTYQQAVAPAWATYERANASAWAAYEQANASAWATYEQAAAPALATYEQAAATALAGALGLP